MNRTMLMAGAAALALSTAARAADIPAPCDPRATTVAVSRTEVGKHTPDPRERCIDYVPGQVIRLYAAPGATLTIELPATERIIFQGVSDNGLIAGETEGSDREAGSTPQAEETKDRNLMVWIIGGPDRPMNFLTLKPLRPLEPQPFLILAQYVNPIDGKMVIRKHLFDLRTRVATGEAAVSALGEDSEDTFFSVKLVDREGDRLTRQAEWRARNPRRVEDAEAQEDRRVRGRLRQVSVASAGTATVNKAYVGQGTPEDRQALSPVGTTTEPGMWDDGSRTYLRYPGNQPVPMAYQVIGGAEALVEQHVEDDPTTQGHLLVLHSVYASIRLRDAPGEIGTSAAKAAERVLCIFNRRFDPRGRNTGTGTSSPDVIREWRNPARVAAR